MGDFVKMDFYILVSLKITVQDWLLTAVEAHIVESKFQN
jgi:hypothetical protein